MVTFGPYRMDLATGELFRSEILVKLQPQPAKLLVMLVARAGEVVTREEIRRTVWGSDTFVDFDQSVNFCVRQIRTALHDSADKPCYLETLPRRGYRFMAPVQPLPERSTEPSPLQKSAVAPSSSNRIQWRRLAVACCALLLVAVAAGDRVRRHARSDSATATQRALREVEIGRFFLNKATRDDALRAIEHFEAAAGEDSQCAPAYAGLAESYNQLAGVFVAGKRPENARFFAMRAATRAMQLDPNLAEPYVAFADAAMHELDWSEAERSLRRAIELNPRYATAHQHYGSFLAAQRRFPEAIAEARLAVDLAPVSLQARENFAWMLYFNHQYEEAVRELRAIVQMDRAFARGHWRLGQVLLVQGKYDEAVAALQVSVELSNRGPAALGLLAMAYGGRGQLDEAQRIVDELAGRSANETVPPGASMLGYLGINDKAAALDVFERAYEEHDGYAMFADADPLMDPLRNEPRFQELCRKIMRGSSSRAMHPLEPQALVRR